MDKDTIGSDVPGIHHVRSRVQRGELTFLVGRGARTFALEYCGIDTLANERTLAGLHPSAVAKVVNLIDRRHRACKPGEAPTLYTTLNPLVLNELEPERVFLLTHWGRRVTPITATKNFAERAKIYALGELWLSYLHETPDDSEPDLIPVVVPDAWEEYLKASQDLERTSPLMAVVEAGAARLDEKPEYRASVEARAELSAERLAANKTAEVPSAGKK